MYSLDRMKSQHQIYYRLASGVDIVPLRNGHILIRSDTLTLRLEGGSSRDFVERVLPLLDGRRSLSEITRELPDLPGEDLSRHLELLAKADVLRSSDHPQGQQSIGQQALAPFLSMLESLGIPASESLDLLSRSRVAVVGLEGHGAHLASILSRCGIGSMVLVDPYPCELGNLALMPLLGPDSAGKARHDAVKAALGAQGCKTEIVTGGDQVITGEGIAALVADCQMLAGCFDKGFSSTNHWINRASLDLGIPAIYAQSMGHIALVGPMVLPGDTACYMCYRMRSLACAEDFSEVMTYEEFLDRMKRPALHERAVLPTTTAYVASLMALEILKHLLSLSQPSLANKVLEFDAFSLQTATHNVLQKPDCPVCSEKKKCERPHPLITELVQRDTPPGDLPAVSGLLISGRTGIVKHFHRIQKDASEPTRPYIFRAELANHRFLEKEARRNATCSGKGITLVDAQISALGEAVERYSGSCWDHGEVVYARREELDGESLDPRQLVLYLPNQYHHLPYVPYKDESTMGWVRARSLVTGSWIFVPALSVFMNYEVQCPEEFICPITSNGLAAGSTLLMALVRASCEVLERDAFIITWLNRLPCQQIDPCSHPDTDIIEVCETYRRRNVKILLYRLPTDDPCHVFLSMGVDENGNDSGPAVVVGLGADVDPIRAARQAILEVAQVRPALRRRMRRPETRQRMEQLVADPCLVNELEDHDLLYASRASLKAFDFLFESPLSAFSWEYQLSRDPADKIEELINYLRGEGRDLLYYNLTFPDMRALGLHTVRVIIPGYQPIHFGWKERRLGGDRLYELPLHLGITGTRRSPEQLNRDPHPLS